MIDKILEERGRHYGDFQGHARITQEIKVVFQTAPKWHGMSYDKQEALDMIAHKIGRILNGDPGHKDSWDDIAGYAILVANTLPEEKKDV